ncbi:PilZ domain-containing protein [Clostridium frigoris]|uniref:PilZ domain-containing protein n=1 Tax=Clostridium frigoris TaxID=205327 RepID=A0ABS6BY94_9CLOT|nr:PilZ domain-containing protein [Clostridium frigoris]MBU3161568.1 PilZ domain-containing protein [Clostridium frigoris]
MDIVGINENDVVKLINSNKSLVNGKVVKISHDYLGIKINNKQDAHIELKKGESIELIFIYSHEAMRCSSGILGVQKKGNEQYIIISTPVLIYKIERRKFERVSVILEAEYSPLYDDEDYKELKDVDTRYFRFFRKTYTVNISAGGVCIVIPKSELNSKFALVNLTIKNETITILCTNVRVTAMNDNTHNKVDYEYKDITEKHRQLILDFVAQKSKQANKDKII